NENQTVQEKAEEGRREKGGRQVTLAWNRESGRPESQRHSFAIARGRGFSASRYFEVGNLRPPFFVLMARRFCLIQAIHEEAVLDHERQFFAGVPAARASRVSNQTAEACLGRHFDCWRGGAAYCRIGCLLVH